MDCGFVEVVVFIAFVDLAWSGEHGVCYHSPLFFAFAELESVRGVVCASVVCGCVFANLRPTIGVGLPGLTENLASDCVIPHGVPDKMFSFRLCSFSGFGLQGLCHQISPRAFEWFFNFWDARCQYWPVRETSRFSLLHSAGRGGVQQTHPAGV